MEVAISAVAGELASRFISFLLNKYRSKPSRSDDEELMERLQHLLMRVSMVIEEADARYITNSGMLLHLKMFSEAMYRGYRILDTLRYRTLQDSAGFDEVSIKDSSRSSMYLAIPLKRPRTTTKKDDKAMCLESLGALESLEVAIANMAEFVILLGGCERMSRRPYDIYLYTDNFMFDRHAEKQKLLSFLLQHRPAGDAPAILPIIGGAKVGKKTLVAHVCGDDRVRSCFSSILHLSGNSLLSHERTISGMKMLVVIEFASDVSDDEWKNFQSFLVTMGRGSHVIIISRIQRLARFGSVKPIFLRVISYDEWRYLFKTLAFGSVDPVEHPSLLKIADEVAKQLHTQGSLVATNAYADLLRRNLNAQFWHCILDKGIGMIKRNIAMYGVHPSRLIEQGHPVDITDFAMHPLSMIPYTTNVSIKKDLQV